MLSKKPLNGSGFLLRGRWDFDNGDEGGTAGIPPRRGNTNPAPILSLRRREQTGQSVSFTAGN